MPHMIYLMSLNQNFVNFPLRNFTSFSSQRITRFWIVDENIPLLSFPKKCVSRKVSTPLGAAGLESASYI